MLEIQATAHSTECIRPDASAVNGSIQEAIFHNQLRRARSHFTSRIIKTKRMREKKHREKRGTRREDTITINKGKVFFRKAAEYKKDVQVQLYNKKSPPLQNITFSH